MRYDIAEVRYRFMLSSTWNRAFVAFVGATALLLAASSPLAQQASPSQTQDPQQQPPPRPLPSPSGQISRPPIRFALPRRTYLCADGVQLSLLVEKNAVRLTLKGQIYNLNQAEAATGAKYSSGPVSWTTDGGNDNGTLKDETDPGNPTWLAKDCQLQSTFPPTGTAAGTVTGTVSYRERVSLPAGAILIVELQDVTLADAPAPTIAKTETKVGKRQVPLPFRLTFDPAKIDPKHTYAIEARILANGRLLFTNDTLYPVLTQGHPAKADLLLKAVESPGPAPQLPR